MPARVTIHHAPHLEPAAQQALSVLAAFVARQTGRRVERRATLASPTALVMGDAPDVTLKVVLRSVAHDGYSIWPGREGLLLAGRTAKGLLNAVYGYLAWAGVRWTVRCAQPVKRAYRRAGVSNAFFFDTEALLEPTWREKIAALPRQPRAKKR